MRNAATITIVVGTVLSLAVAAASLPALGQAKTPRFPEYFTPDPELGQRLRGVNAGEPEDPPSITAFAFSNRLALTAALVSDSSPAFGYEHCAILTFSVANTSVPIARLPNAMVFLLDADRRQIYQLSLRDMRYSMDLAVAANETIRPPPPPVFVSAPPYEVRGTVGGENVNLVVQPQADYKAMGYAVGTFIRQFRLRKENKRRERLRDAVHALMEFEEQNTFDGDRPLIAGEERSGTIEFASHTPIRGPLHILLFVTDVQTGEQEMITLRFQGFPVPFSPEEPGMRSKEPRRRP